MAPTEPTRIEVFADISCPFTHVGLKKVTALFDELDGFRPDHWPDTTIPALNLAADAYARDPATGLAVSLDLRATLFEKGNNVADPEVLAEVAHRRGLPAPATDASETVRADYDDGKARGVRGSPDFWVGDDEFFCPSLSIGHDDDGALTAEFDPDGLREFIDRTTR